MEKKINKVIKLIHLQFRKGWNKLRIRVLEKIVNPKRLKKILTLFSFTKNSLIKILHSYLQKYYDFSVVYKIAVSII